MRLLLLSVLLLCLGAQAAVPLAELDDMGDRVSLPAPAQRIVSLSPHTTELLYAVGAGPQIVATVEGSDHPPEAATLPWLGDALHPDMERILAAQPDLVVAWQSGNGDALIERLRAQGLRVFASEPRQLSDVANNLASLGRLSGHDEQGRGRAKAFLERWQELQRRFSHRPRVSVFYQVWHRPLITVNGDHLISELIRLCGGENVFAELNGLAPTLSIEAVLAADPAVMIADRAEGLNLWRDWPQLRAVRNGQLYVLSADLLQRQGPRILDGAEQLCDRMERARQATPPTTQGRKD